MSAEALLARDERSASQIGSASRYGWFALSAFAFGLYWLSALVLEARGGTTHFGADAHLYSMLAKGFAHERVTRFHPLTTAMALAWLKILSPLTVWVSPPSLLKAMFAAVGAAGVWAAMAAFAAVLPRRYVLPLGAIYATSLGIWYFASIEESKIVSATLAALYIATYLRLREGWTPSGAALLTAILLLACLNEIVAGFLVVIPAVDTLVQRGWYLRQGRWIVWHGLAAPVALVFLEGVVNGRLAAAGPHSDAASHIGMLIHYVTRNDFSAESLYRFAIAWLFFTIAAPSTDATYGARANYAGDYGADVTLLSYFSSPAPAGLVLAFGLIVAASVPPRYRCERVGGSASLLLALLAYALVRAAFFLVFNPRECLLFSSSATLAHLVLIGIPFAASGFPAKRGLLAAFALLLFLTNGAFILGR
jgi:hypothetical protein